MRTLTRTICCLAMLALLAGFARAQDDPKAIVAKAIKAHGGEDKLSKLKVTKIKAKGTIDIMGNEVEFTLEAISQLPNQLRNEIKMEIGGNAITVVQVLNKDKGWMSAMGQTMDLEGEMLEELQEEAYGNVVESLVPLLRDKEFKLEALGESKVEGKDAVGIKVAHKGRRELKLFFDKSTGLLAKTQKRSKEMGNEVDVESFAKDYKDVDGVKTAMKLLVKHDGKKYIEGEVTEVKLLEKIDASTFAKP